MKDIESKLRQLHRVRRDELWKEWKRDLPFSELLVDRWERASRLGFKKKASIYDNSYVFGDVAVGEETWVGPFTVLDGSGGLEIGHHCSISTGVQIYSHDTVKWAVSGGKEPHERSPTRIGNCCYIGPHTVVTRGVTIGDHCVVGAFSLVNMDLPPCSVAFGTPCRVTGHVVILENGSVRLEIVSEAKPLKPREGSRRARQR